MSESATPPTEVPPAIARAVEILEGLLKHSGVEAEVQLERCGRDVILQIESEQDAEVIAGKEGKRAEDFQYLVNRLLHREYPTVPRVRLDIGHQRERELVEFVDRIRGLIEEVAETGKPRQLEPLNSYFRRLVHNLIATDDRVNSWSPPSNDRLKQITVMPVRH